jgi:hypothetical protein
MNIAEAHKLPIRGEIELFHLFDNGRVQSIHKQRNVILNSGMDIAARALAGNINVNGMYMAYENSAPPIAEPTPAATTTALYYQTTGSTDPRGFVRVPTIAMPAFSSTDTQYNTNKATFVAISDGNVAIPDGGNTVQDGVSQFYGAALAYLDPEGYAGDILFSAISFKDIGTPTEFEKIAGAQIGIRWAIWFELP